MDEQLKSLDSIYVERSTDFKKLVQNIKEYRDIDFVLPEGINGTLREYQISGFKWLKTPAHYGFGGILADDMGLGKTLQATAFLLSEKENETKPSMKGRIVFS